MESHDKPLELHENYRNRPRRRVNWRQAAELLARGLTLEAAAKTLRCPVPVLRRNLRRSPEFRARIAQAAEQRRLRIQLRAMALGEATVMQLRPAETTDSRILQWLGGLDRAAPAERPDGDIATRWAFALGLTSRQQQAQDQAQAAKAAHEASLWAMLQEVRRDRADQDRADQDRAAQDRAAQARADERLADDSRAG